MSIAYVLVQCLIGHEMEVLRSLLEINFVKKVRALLGIMTFLLKLRRHQNNKLKILLPKELEK